MGYGRSLGLAAAVLLAATLITACMPAEGSTDPRRIDGGLTVIGEGTVESYAELGAGDVPMAIGVKFSAGALRALPEIRTDGHRCADLDGDGSIEEESECLPWHERVVFLPTEISRRDDMPFKWTLLNWNPMGHIPEGVWNVPHFDIHFYMEPIEKVFALMPGPCGPERMRCDQYEVATRPLPAQYMHRDFRDVGAAAPAMGNHLVDPTGPEFDGEPFTRSWIYGVYDGRVTFWEEMQAITYMTSEPDDCYDIKTPPAVDRAGWYPSRVCTRYEAGDGSVSVSLEAFTLREAEPPVSGD